MLREELEDGLAVESSFEGNARRKAEHFAKLSGMPTIADDSGLEVMSLGGAPGVRSKRWSGVSGTEAQVTAANNAELLRRLSGAPATKRTARYRCGAASPEEKDVIGHRGKALQSFIKSLT